MSKILFVLMMVAIPMRAAAEEPVHVWEKQELALEARGKYDNPYTDVEVWIDLKGPNFAKRVYGFWDGDPTFRIRYPATAPGKWSWVSGSSPLDKGLSGRKGVFTAVAWSDKEKQAN